MGMTLFDRLAEAEEIQLTVLGDASVTVRMSRGAAKHVARIMNTFDQNAEDGHTTDLACITSARKMLKELKAAGVKVD